MAIPKELRRTLAKEVPIIALINEEEIAISQKMKTELLHLAKFAVTLFFVLGMGICRAQEGAFLIAFGAEEDLKMVRITEGNGRNVIGMAAALLEANLQVDSESDRVLKKCIVSGFFYAKDWLTLFQELAKYVDGLSGLEPGYHLLFEYKPEKRTVFVSISKPLPKGPPSPPDVVPKEPQSRTKKK